MRISIFAPALFLMLTACPPPQTVETLPPVTDGDSDIYKAIGTEPGWLLEMDDNEIRYTGDYGETSVTVATPVAMPSFNGLRYVTPDLTVDITYSECNDGMSDRRYAHSVIVSTRQTSVYGCGGDILPPADLNGTNWRIIGINGMQPANGQAAQIQFSDGQVSASIGCNRFGASYQADKSKLTTGPARATRMACPGMLMNQEAVLSRFFDTPVSIRFMQEEKMLLSAGDQTLLLARVI